MKNTSDVDIIGTRHREHAGWNWLPGPDYTYVHKVLVRGNSIAITDLTDQAINKNISYPATRRYTTLT
jgi:hypothetical protein